MYNYEIRLFPQKAEDGTTYWTARFPAVEGCVGGGETPEEAVAEAQENLEYYISFLEEEKRAIPAEYDPPEYNGKIALRVSKRTHRRLAEISAQEGVSINSLLITAVEHFLGKKEYDYQFDRKIDRIKTLAGMSFYMHQQTNAMVADLWSTYGEKQPVATTAEGD